MALSCFKCKGIDVDSSVKDGVTTIICNDEKCTHIRTTDDTSGLEVQNG